MATEKQKLGDYGEKLIAKKVDCLNCKTPKSLKQLPPNFKCADLICDFCGYLAQVKAMKVADVDQLPKTVLGAAWAPQKKRMDAGIYFPLFLVLVDKINWKYTAIYYLPIEFQTKSIFVKRKPLSSSARRAGWQGFYYDLSKLERRNSFIRIQ